MNYRTNLKTGKKLAPALLLLLPLAAFAEPVGEMLTLSEMGEAMLVMSGASIEDEAAKIPSREAVGLPVYPGSYYTAQFSAQGMLPAVILASSDPMEKVKAWYAMQEGLTWSDMFEMFHVGDSYEMMVTESVMLQDISEDPSQSTGGLGGFDMSGMKTQITISFERKGE